MKATYQPEIRQWLLVFDTFTETNYFLGVMWMAGRLGVEICQLGDTVLALVLPDDNPNPFTTDALRPGAAVGAAELGAVLTTAGNPLGGSHPVHYALMDKVNGLCYCTHSGAIRLSTRPLISGDELYGWCIHSFPPFTDPQ